MNKKKPDDPLNIPNFNSTENIWRQYMQRIYIRLLYKWAGDSLPEPSLKTDLYDEAITAKNMLPILAKKSGFSIGMDISSDVASRAKNKLGNQGTYKAALVVCDTRKLAFKTETYGSIFSNSTLDHFLEIKDIQVSLREFFRVLKPAGTLILTMDNPQNPIICIRNLLPYRSAKALGVIPFYMGKTLHRRVLIQLLEAVGFEVRSVTAVTHAPRFIALHCERLLKKSSEGKLQNLLLRILLLCEYLEALPTRYFTGHFLVVMATKKPPLIPDSAG